MSVLSSKDHAVVIVGGGPTGLMLAGEPVGEIDVAIVGGRPYGVGAS